MCVGILFLNEKNTFHVPENHGVKIAAIAVDVFQFLTQPHKLIFRRLGINAGDFVGDELFGSGQVVGIAERKGVPRPRAEILQAKGIVVGQEIVKCGQILAIVIAIQELVILQNINTL